MAWIESTEIVLVEIILLCVEADDDSLPVVSDEPWEVFIQAAYVTIFWSRMITVHLARMGGREWCTAMCITHPELARQPQR